MNKVIFSSGGFPVITKFLFDNLINDTWNNDMVRMKSDYPMNIVEMMEKDEVIGYRLEYAFSGFDKSEISVSVEDNVLTVKADKKDGIYEEGYSERFIRQGLSYKSFEINYKLMDTVDQDSIKVKFADGLLKIYLPLKAEIKKTKTIEIE